MTERTCRNCFHYSPGNGYPDYDQRGTCSAVHATSFPAGRPAQIRPCGDAWLEVSINFCCSLHLPTPKEPKP